MLLKENPPSKNVQVFQYLAKKFPFMLEFQLVPFAFSFILGDPFIVSPPHIKFWEGGLLSKKNFSWGTNFLEKIDGESCSTWGY